MSWNTDATQSNRFVLLQSTNYNNSVSIDYTNLNIMVENFNGLFGNFTDYNDEISSVLLFPFELKTVTPISGSVFKLYTTRDLDKNVVVGKLLAEQFYNMGTVTINRKFNNFADYNGYTKISVFLPCLGFIDLDTNEVMGKELSFGLYVDTHTGKGVYYIYVLENGEQRLITTVETQLAVEIPLGSSNIGDIKRNLALGAVTMAISGGLGGASAMLPTAASTAFDSGHTTTYDIRGQGKAKNSPMRQLKEGTVIRGESYKTTKTNVSPSAKVRPFIDAFQSGMDTLNRMYGGSSGDRPNNSGSFLPITKRIHIVIRRPRIVETDFTGLFGKPLNVVGKLSQYHGYTEIDDIRYENMPCNFQELQMLDEVLSGGIIAP